MVAIVRYVLECTSAGALAAAALAADEYDLEAETRQIAAEQAGNDRDDPPEAGTIYKALTWGPLDSSYSAMLQAWLDAPASSFLLLDALAAKLNLSVGQVQARFSKLSARLKRVATPAELAGHKKSALGLLVETAYAGETTSHKLTPAGRVAVRRYLGH